MSGRQFPQIARAGRGLWWPGALRHHLREGTTTPRQLAVAVRALRAHCGQRIRVFKGTWTASDF